MIKYIVIGAISKIFYKKVKIKYFLLNYYYSVIIITEKYLSNNRG